MRQSVWPTLKVLCFAGYSDRAQYFIAIPLDSFDHRMDQVVAAIWVFCDAPYRVLTSPWVFCQHHPCIDNSISGKGNGWSVELTCTSIERSGGKRMSWCTGLHWNHTWCTVFFFQKYCQCRPISNSFIGFRKSKLQQLASGLRTCKFDFSLFNLLCDLVYSSTIISMGMMY